MPHVVYLVDTKDNLALPLSHGWPYALQGFAPKAGRRHLILRGDPSLQPGQDLAAGKFLNVDENLVVAVRDGDKGIASVGAVRTQQTVPVKITDPNWFVLAWKYGIKNGYGAVVEIRRPNLQLRAFAAEAPSNGFYVAAFDTTGTQTGSVLIPQDQWPGQGVWMLVGVAKIDGRYYVVHSHSSQGPIAGPLAPPTQEAENFLIRITTAGIADNIWVGGAFFGAFKLTADLVRRIAALGYQAAVAVNPDVWPGPPYDFYWPLVEDLRGYPVGDNPMVQESSQLSFSSPYSVPRWPGRIRAIQAVLEGGVQRQEAGHNAPVSLLFLPQGAPPSSRVLSPVVAGQVDTPDDLLGWKAVTGQVYDVRVGLTRKPYFEDCQLQSLSKTAASASDLNWSVGPITSDLPPDIQIVHDTPIVFKTNVLCLQNDASQGFYDLAGSNFATNGAVNTVADAGSAGGSYINFSGGSFFIVNFTADQVAKVARFGPYVWFVVRMWNVAAPTIYIQRALGSSRYKVGPTLRMLQVGPNLWMSEAPLPLAAEPATDVAVVVDNIQGGNVDCFIWGVNLARWVSAQGADVFDSSSVIWRRITPLTVAPGATLYFAWSNPALGWYLSSLGGSMQVSWRPRYAGVRSGA